MDSRTRFSTQAKDPFAGSVLFGSGNSPQATQTHSPVMHQTSAYGMLSPMQAMDGVSTIRSPYQGRRFGTHDSAQKSVRGMRSESKRPPLASIMDDKMSILSNADTLDEHYPHSTPGPVSMDQEDGRGLFSADREQSFSNSAPRPPLRSSLDVFSGGRGASAAMDRLDRASSNTGGVSGSAESEVRSPVLTLGPYEPSMDRVDAAWSCWIVVSGFYPSAAGRDAVLQLFLQFGDIDDHVLTSGNYLYIKYMSPVHAERAASQHGSFLNSDTLLSVLVLNPRLAQHMGLSLSREGSLKVANALLPGGPTSSREQLLGETEAASSGAGALGGGLRQRPTTSQNISRDPEHNSLLHSDREIAARKAKLHDTPELYLQPSRRKNICERVVEYFFAY